MRSLRNSPPKAGFRAKQPRFVRSHVHSILTTPIYHGLIHKGTLYEGNHEPIITKAVYDRVQAIIRRKGKGRPKELKPYPYRGTFRCGECGAMITTETQIGPQLPAMHPEVEARLPQPVCA